MSFEFWNILYLYICCVGYIDRLVCIWYVFVKVIMIFNLKDIWLVEVMICE